METVIGDQCADLVFRALANPRRRLLLDSLRIRDGQSQRDLNSGLPLTRFGVMKHLKALKWAGLVERRKVGRRTTYHLNPSPILLAQVWVSRF